MDHTAGLIMAGGRSTRMRAGGSSTHKGLRTVGGLPLIQWNLEALLSCGLRELFVSVSAHEPALCAWIEQVGRGLASARGASLEVLVETQPLGTVGAAGSLPGTVGEVLVVNVDNLSRLDLGELLAFHRSEGAAATLASHLQPFALPFGLLELEGRRVRAYREKPQLPLSISSGTCVLGRRALSRVEKGQRLDVPRLVELLLEAGEPVAAFQHRAAWVDVNDEAALAQAQALFAQRQGEEGTP